MVRKIKEKVVSLQAHLFIATFAGGMVVEISSWAGIVGVDNAGTGGRHSLSKTR